MKKVIFALALICLVILIPNMGLSGTTDVHIKGVDDGRKTTKQNDYKEAVLFAKREAIERAGVKIRSMTTVKDMVVNSDYIESKAEAVLMPGYDIVDIGYTADGTYQIVLIGKVKTGQSSSSIGVNEIDTEGWRYTAYNDGTVLDKKTQLMWAAEDNGAYITWEDAKKYCEEFNRGGYSDWRLPTREELEELEDPDQKNRYGYKIVRLIDTRNCSLWAEDRAVGIFHRSGYRCGGSSNVLPVRSAK